MRKLFVAAATVAIFALLVTPAMAKGPKGGGGSAAATAPKLTVNDTDVHYGETVTITADYEITGNVKYSVGVNVTCWDEPGDPFYMYAQFTQNAGPFSPAFTLGHSSVATTDGTYWWDGGGAHCSVDLFYYTWQGQSQTGRVDLTSTTFDVAA
jgi:hypothetical protein